MGKALALDTFSAFFVRHYTEQMSIVLYESKRHIHDKIWHMNTDDLDCQNARIAGIHEVNIDFHAKHSPQLVNHYSMNV